MCPKRRYYNKFHSNKDKYSIEQTNFNIPSVEQWTTVEPEDSTQATSLQWFIDVVPPVQTQGMRKVKHLTISLANIGNDNEQEPIIYNILYVPQGYQPQSLRFPAIGYAQNNYQANQFVMSSGVIDFSGGPTRIRSKLSRNLNSGDRIVIALATEGNNPSTYGFLGQVSYAITLQ